MWKLLLGQFIWTTTITDKYSGWTENRASFGKDATSALTAITAGLWNFPCTVKSFNTDSGTEFINHKFQEFLDKKGIEFTRSRPYKKNDNCHVEQKNFTHVRERFGYGRFDKEELIFIMNSIYSSYFNIFQNFFVPQLKAIKVTRVGAKYKRKYDKAGTPYQRLIDSGKLSNYQTQQLTEKYDSLNPIQLKKDLNDMMKRLIDS